ncbi:MAG: hypothetical protein DI607_11970 [Sphingomonas hengshuiensis]|nr:MAG: hypothetical protein DI607_11970 [Sphingomonas hengshuiensis]
MIIDKRNEFADATAIPTATGTALVGNVIDLGAGSPTLNDVEQIYLVLDVETAATSGGSATVQFSLASDAQAAIATDGSATVHFQTAAIPVANLTAGKRIIAVALPKGVYERYLGILATVGTAALTAGKIDAFLTSAVPTWVAVDAPFQL